MMRDWNAVVVGSGPAGIIAAESLRDCGMSVAIVEAGARLDPEAAISQPAEGHWPFESAGEPIDWLRVRAVGGASLAWGGWCDRFPHALFRRGHWPVDGLDMDPYYDRAEHRIGAEPVPVSSRYRRCAERLGLPVTAMQSARTGERSWSSASAPISRTVMAETTALAVESAPGDRGRLQVVTGGRERELTFRHLLLACSPVESARLLLASGLGRNAGVGRGLTYHPVAGFALVEPPGPEGETVNGALLEVARSACGLDQHFGFELTGPFEYLNLSAELQSRVRAASDLQPRSRVTFIHGFYELGPTPQRYVDLHPTRRDAVGMPVPRIYLGWSETELAGVRAMQSAALDIAEALADDGGQLVEYLDPIARPMLFHEAGTCAYGKNASLPCDPRGRLRGTAGIWLVDASVFPTSGDRHPTLTILAHALRVADAVAAAGAGR